MQDIRDEAGHLLLRYDPEACILELMTEHYDNMQGRRVRRRRLVAIQPDKRLELLPLDTLLEQAMTIKPR